VDDEGSAGQGARQKIRDTPRAYVVKTGHDRCGEGQNNGDGHSVIGSGAQSHSDSRPAALLLCLEGGSDVVEQRR